MPPPSALTELDTFPRLLLNHAPIRAAHPATREKDLGIWQTWTWSQVDRRGARARLRPGGARLQARDESRHHRRQPPAPLLGDGRGAVAGRRPGAALPGRGGRGDGLRAQRRRHPLRRRRGPGAGRQAAGDPGPLPAISSTSSSTTRAGCATTRRTSCTLRGRPGTRPRASRSASGFLPRPRSRQDGPTTSRSWSTPRGPPASRRASASPTPR